MSNNVSFEAFKRRVWSLLPHTQLNEVGNFFDVFVDEVKHNVLAEGKSVRIPGFGTFYRRETAGRSVTTYRRVEGGTEVAGTHNVPPTYTVRFRPANNFRKTIE